MSRLCIHSVHLIDGAGGSYPEVDVFIDQGMIVEVRHPAEDPPADWELIDGSGKTLMPGLIDGHVHLTFDSSPRAPFFALGKTRDEIVEHALQGARQQLAAGVTTLRDIGGTVHGEFSIRDELKAFDAIPTIYDCIATLSGTGGVGLDVALEINRQNVRSVVDYLAGKADTLKLLGDRYDTQSPDGFAQQFDDGTFASICELAREAGLPVTVHAKASGTIRQCIENRVHCIEHAVGATPSSLEAIAKAGIFVEPTFWGLVNRAKAVPGFDEHHRNQAWLTEALEAGVPIALGSDSGTIFTPQGGAPYELKMMVEAGMSPMEAIRSGTQRGAELVQDPTIGQVAPGKKADLLLLSSDPSKDINAISRDLVWVMKAGRIVKERRNREHDR